jgi:hypothetical protein
MSSINMVRENGEGSDDARLPGRAVLLALSWVVLVGACGKGGEVAADAALPPDASPASGPEARFDPPEPGAGADWGAVPFPSDLYLGANGQMALSSLPLGANPSMDQVELLLEAINTMDGAGIWSNIYFPIVGEIDPATLAGNVRLVDLDADLAEVPVDLLWRADLGTIVIAPQWGTLLAEKRRYGAYVTSGVTDPQGRSLSPAPAFAAAVDLDRAPADARIEAARASLLPLLEGLGDSADTVVAATVFRTASVTDDAVAMRAAVAASPPQVSAHEIYGPDEEGERGLQRIFGEQEPDAVPGVIHGPGTRAQPHGNVEVVIHGTIDIPSFLSETPGVAGRLTYDGEGAPVIKGHHPVRYTLILPRAQSWEALPVVVYVHGVGRTRADMVVQAETVTARGMALIAIDLLYHGDRGDGGDQVNDITGEPHPDGFGDLEGLFPAVRFFHMTGSGGLPAYSHIAQRENLRQAAIDICSLVSFVVGGDVTPIAEALAAHYGEARALSFRSDTVALLTESFGGALGLVAVAIEPRLGAASVSSAAFGFPYPAMLHSPNYSGTFSGVLTTPYGIADRVVLGDPLRGARFEPILNLYNNVLASGEVSGFAAHLLSGVLRGGQGPSLLLTQSFGDEWVSNDATEKLAGVLGVPRVLMTAPMTAPLRYVDLAERAAPLASNVAAGQTAGLTLWHPSPHAVLRKLTDLFEYEPDFPPFQARQPPEPVDPTPIAELHAQYGHFLTTFFAGTPEIIDPYAP